MYDYETSAATAQGRARVVAPPWQEPHIAANVPPYWIAHALPEGSRVLLVGDATGFYYPPGTIYATAFNVHPLEPLADKPAPVILAALREMGVTHILVRWPEIWRLANTYGYPASLSAALFHPEAHRAPPTLPILETLREAGMKIQHVGHRIPGSAAFDPKKRNPYCPPPDWPTTTLYALTPVGAPADWAPPKLSPPKSHNEDQP